MYDVGYILYRKLGVTVFQNSNFLKDYLKKSHFSSHQDLPQMSFSAKFMEEKIFQNFNGF